jgi:hypothetical protein
MLPALAQIQVSLDLTLNGVLALIAGVLILLFPRLLNYIVAVYLIVIGLIEILSL